MNTLTNMIQVNIPYTMLCQSYLDRFITHRLNPEIGFDADALDHCSLSDVNIVARRLCDCGLTITLHAPFIDLSPGSPDPEVRRLTQKRIEQVVRLIPFFKPKTVVCHAGYDHKRYWHMKDLWLENSMKTWSWLAKRISEEGSRLMLENVYEQHPHDRKEELWPSLKYLESIWPW